VHEEINQRNLHLSTVKVKNIGLFLATEMVGLCYHGSALTKGTFIG
jgi:hypothetical protein